MELELKQYQCDCCGCLTEAKLTPNLDFWVCRCDWDDYFDFRIIADCGKGHVRVSFFPDEVFCSVFFWSLIGVC